MECIRKTTYELRLGHGFVRLCWHLSFGVVGKLKFAKRLNLGREIIGAPRPISFVSCDKSHILSSLYFGNKICFFKTKDIFFFELLYEWKYLQILCISSNDFLNRSEGIELDFETILIYLLNIKMYHEIFLITETSLGTRLYYYFPFVFSIVDVFLYSSIQYI